MAITFDNVAVQNATAYGAVTNTAASSASTPATGDSDASAASAPASTPASYASLAADTLSALIAVQAEDSTEPYYPPAPTPPPPPPGTISRAQTASTAAAPETKLSDVLDAIRATPANSAPAADTSKIFSKRDAARTGTQTPGVSQTQAQTMQRIASSQAGIAILQVASVTAAYNAQFSASTFNNGFATGLGANSVSRFSSSFAFNQNRLF